jgi:hypothetical protein
LGAENITKNAQKQQKIEKNCLKSKKTPIYTQISLKMLRGDRREPLFALFLLIFMIIC